METYSNILCSIDCKIYKRIQLRYTPVIMVILVQNKGVGWTFQPAVPLQLWSCKWLCLKIVTPNPRGFSSFSLLNAIMWSIRHFQPIHIHDSCVKFPAVMLKSGKHRATIRHFHAWPILNLPFLLVQNMAQAIATAIEMGFLGYSFACSLTKEGDGIWIGHPNFG